jgi:hypothetical protein
LECGSLLPLFRAEACFGGAGLAPRPIHRIGSKLAATQSGSKLPHSKEGDSLVAASPRCVLCGWNLSFTIAGDSGHSRARVII